MRFFAIQFRPGCRGGVFSTVLIIDAVPIPIGPVRAGLVPSEHVHEQDIATSQLGILQGRDVVCTGALHPPHPTIPSFVGTLERSWRNRQRADLFHQIDHRSDGKQPVDRRSRLLIGLVILVSRGMAALVVRVGSFGTGGFKVGHTRREHCRST